MEEIRERLRGAAQAGNIDELYAIIGEEAHVLESIDEIPFYDTPLHVASAAGHTDFAIEVMKLKPSLAFKLNPGGFSPIHSALQNGQKDTVLDLLGIDKELVRVKGREGKTPLHYVVGESVDVGLIITFLLCCPECIRDVTNRNETALHIAAQNNLLEVFQLLVGWLRRTNVKDGKAWENEVLNWKNKEGDTVLHVAASNNQPQMAKLLLECGIDKNAKNWSGLTALDILQAQNQVSNTQTTEILRGGGCLKASSIPTTSSFPNYLRSEITLSEKSNIILSRMRKNISNSTRNALLVVLVLILTATYQSAVNPPYELVSASFRQSNDPALGNLQSNARSFPFQDPNNQPESGAGFPCSSSSIRPIDVKVDALALSFAIFNAIDFLVTILVTLFILPLVPYGQLLHVLLLLVFIFFVVSMGLSLVLTTSNVGIIIFAAFAAFTMFLGIFIIKIKVRNRKIYRQHIKEFVERARILKNEDAINKKK